MKHYNQLIVSKWGAILGNRKLPCSLGFNGISIDKVEGDRTTPAGTYSMGPIFYRCDRLTLHNCKIKTTPIKNYYKWSDDPNDLEYNSLIDINKRWPFSHEKLFRADPLYDIIIPVHYNTVDPKPGKGSAIFIHTWRGPRISTEGCVAFSRKDILWFCEVLSPLAKVKIISV